jgi:Tfp pilus assembly protein PilF
MKTLFLIILFGLSAIAFASPNRVDEQLGVLSGKKAPRIAQGFLDKGYEKLELGDIDGAAKDWENAIKHYDLFKIYYFVIAENYYDTGKIKESCHYYLKTAESDKHHEQARMKLGICEMHNKHWQIAINYFNESLALLPNQALAYFYLASSYGILKEHEQAKESLTKALSINPKLRASINNKSVLYKYVQ